MQAGDWPKAAELYRILLDRQPDRGPIWVQYGHALKEDGRKDEAADAYSCAIALMPEDCDALLHQAWLLRDLGRTHASAAAFQRILTIDPAHPAASKALADFGTDYDIPDSVLIRRQTESIQNALHAVRNAADALATLEQAGRYPISRYDQFRADINLPSPTAMPDTDQSFEIVIDAHGIAPSYLRSTLLCLIAQDNPSWTAQVHAGPSISAHSVGSYGAEDPRISFEKRPLGRSHIIVHISAGTILHSSALSWVAYALGETSSAAVYCDWDHGVEHWQHGMTHEMPSMFGVFDRDWIAQSASPPPLVALRLSPDLHVPAFENAGAEVRRNLLLAAAARGTVAHIPMPLATILRMPDRATIAPEGEDRIAPWSQEPGGSPPSPGPVPHHHDLVIEPRKDRPSITICPVDIVRSIAVIIPIRDKPELLERAISSLRAMAGRPERLQFTIIDNGSVLPETSNLLHRLSAELSIGIIRIDEAFNWSRLNNIGAAQTRADVLLFANNDIEMLSSAWDCLLDGYLSRPDVGVVGARLLYPSGRLQHGGVLLGVENGEPRHDGVLPNATADTLTDRSDLVHATSAVTGAFMAIDRSLFEAVGGFDPLNFAIAYNDYDLCLKVRERGVRILYAPSIELNHLESETRGLNDSQARIAWDQLELLSLHRIWGKAMLAEPGLSPWWSSGHPYRELRQPTRAEIAQHIKASAAPNPWKVTRRAER